MRYDVFICLLGTWVKLAAAVTEEDCKKITEMLGRCLKDVKEQRKWSIVTSYGMTFTTSALVAFRVSLAGRDRSDDLQELMSLLRNMLPDKEDWKPGD